jgi:predicted Kef-type K+ transport protein
VSNGFKCNFVDLKTGPARSKPIYIMTFAIWTLLIGVLLIVMVLSATLLKRLPLSTSMIYLAAGFILGPAGWAVLTPSPFVYTDILERVTEVVVLLSLFSVGLKLGLPLSNWHWLLPIRLAFVSMTLTVALVARGCNMGHSRGSDHRWCFGRTDRQAGCLSSCATTSRRQQH